MTNIQVKVLGPVVVEVAGQDMRLPPITTAVLVRLLAAHDELVTVTELFQDVWGGHGPITRREDRVSVQKRILELRRVLDPQRPGESSEVLRTDRGRVSAYRLALDRDQVDMFRFRDLVAQARRSDPATAVDLLVQALALWRGRPMFDVEDHEFARAQVRQLNELRETAMRDLTRAYRDLGLPDRALTVAEKLLVDNPDDGELADEVTALRQQIRARVNGVVRRSFTAPRATVVVTPGDLFAQDDAHLVVGFSDTFDTYTGQDVVISSTSLQGQLITRMYGGDRGRLDQELRAGLRHLTPVGTESRDSKRRGKLTRYPIGTVVALSRTARRIFAVAYSRMGNDLVARSSLADLGTSLDRLWDAVYRHGRLEPVAIPLVGSGLARIDLPSREDLLTFVIESFIQRSRSEAISRELRIVIWPADLEGIKLLDVAAFLRDL